MWGFSIANQQVIQQQILLDSVMQADPNSKIDILSERERAQMKSLQQRLEQLVAVHRQLLRKFATLELENSEYKKKIQLRDERIRQLEGSTRTMTGNMRQQAERHIAELTSLREQIQVILMCRRIIISSTISDGFLLLFLLLFFTFCTNLIDFTCRSPAAS